MPRNMSFAMTTEQIINREKNVTRRFGWWFLEKGDIVNACEKCMGLKKGEKVNKLCQIKIVDVRSERLNTMTENPGYGQKECIREGFPEKTPDEFVEMLTGHYKCEPEKRVNRIEFEYL